MKFLIPLVLALSLSHGERTPTTDDLLQAQEDLTLGHRFFETTLYQGRNQISSYMTIVSQQLLDSFMDSYSEIHYIMDDTNDELAALPANNSCIDAVRNRWELQVHRHGHALSQCLWYSYKELEAWNDYMNELHHGSQQTTMLVPNLGVQVMTEYEDFTGRQDISRPINNAFREIFFRGEQYRLLAEEFRRSVVDNEDQIIEQLTMCDRNLGRAFEIEARNDLVMARRCLE